MRGNGAGNLISTLVLTAALVFTVAANAEMTNGLSEAEIKGQNLARRLCEARPADNLTNYGVLQIRDGTGKKRELPITILTSVTPTNWLNRYTAKPATNATGLTILVITHDDADSSHYRLVDNDQPAEFSVTVRFQTGADATESRTFIPFAGSDFWLCDLGLEFFHWPAQKVLPNTTRLKRGRSYTLLESTNPNPPASGYSRVRSWIDVETGGILEAEAYDAQGKLLKVFEPKSFKKINGQWELQEMEIRNVQTGSRSRLEFDLKRNKPESES